MNNHTALHRLMGWAANFATLGLVGSVIAMAAIHGSQMPSFAALLGKAESETNDWCDTHAVPESICVECHASLAPPRPPRQWCKIHGVHICPNCRPDAAQLDVPAEFLTDDAQRFDRATALVPRPENNRDCKLGERRIQFASTADVGRFGVVFAPVTRQPMIETISAPAEVIADPLRTVHLASRTNGTLIWAKPVVGATVHRGEVIALVESAALADARAELQQTATTMHRAERLLESLKSASDSVPGRSIEQAEYELDEARIRHRHSRQVIADLGAGEPIPAELAALFPSPNLLPVRAPLSGVILERSATVGQSTDPGKPLFLVSDVSRSTLQLHLRVEDADLVQTGQTMRFSVNSNDRTGIVTWISPEVDPVTRTVSARAELDGSLPPLAARTFGVATVVLRAESSAITVPIEAVHSDGCCQIIFVRDRRFEEPGAPKLIHVRSVRTGMRSNSLVEVLAGLAPGEIVATFGSGILRSELLKNNLGAGCGCCH